MPVAPEDEIILPGESLSKHRDKPGVAPTPVPTVEHETREEQNTVEEITPRATSNLPAAAPSGSGFRGRYSGGLPGWLRAGAGAEAEAAPAVEGPGGEEKSSATGGAAGEPSQKTATNGAESARNDVELNEDQVAALASGFVEAKQEETSEAAEVDAIVGDAEFDEEESEEQAEEEAEETEETTVTQVSELSEEETAEVEAGRAANRAEFAADVAQEHAEHHAAHGEHEHDEHEHVDHEHVENEHAGQEHAEEEPISAAAGESIVEVTAIIEDDVILLPGETRAPRIGGPSAPREDFPRDSARIGRQPRRRLA